MVKGKVVLFYVVGIMVSYLSVECLAYLGLQLLRHEKDIIYDPIQSSLTPDQRLILTRQIENPLTLHTLGKPDPVLGWTVRPNARRDSVRVNSQGIRGDREYSPRPAAGTVRVSAFGDSFTFGVDVENGQTWEAQLNRSDPSIEVLNFGVPAYGVDQAYLRYLADGLRFKSDIVVIGFMSENIFRHVNVFRPFYSGAYRDSVFPKPRFTVKDGQLVLLKNPLPATEDLKRFLQDDANVLRELGEHDYYYQVGYRRGSLDVSPFLRFLKVTRHGLSVRRDSIVTGGFYNPQSEAFMVTVRILEEFYRSVRDNGALPVILIYPDQPDLSTQLSGGRRKYEPLLQVLRARGLRHIDALDAFVASDPHYALKDMTVGPWGHYSARGNRIVADHVLKYLRGADVGVRASGQGAMAEGRTKERAGRD